MLIYYFFFILLSFACIFQTKLSIDGKQSIFYVIYIFIIFFVGFRHNVGADWHTYNYYYDNCSNPFTVLNFSINSIKSFIISEPIYHSINFLVCKFNLGVHLVNFISAIFAITPIFYIASKQKDKFLIPVLSFSYFIVVICMGYTRQSIAIGFVLLAIYFWTNKNFYKYLLFSILAFLSHKSAILIFGLILLYTANYYILFFGFIISIVTFSFFYQLIFSKFITYYGQMYSSGTLIRLFINIIPYLVVVQFMQKLFKPREIFIINTFGIVNIVGVILLLFYPLLSTIIDRLSLYTIYSQFFILSNLTFMNKKKEYKIIKILIILIYFVYLSTWLLFSDNAGSWIPYNNLINNFENI